MTPQEMIEDSTQRAITNFQNIKECVKGLYELLKISYPESHIYFKLGLDNIEALYENLLEILVNEAGTGEFIRKVKRSEIDLDIPLDILK